MLIGEAATPFKLTVKPSTGCLTDLLIVSCVKDKLRSKVLRRPAHGEGLGVNHRLALNNQRKGDLLCETEVDDPWKALSIDHNIFWLMRRDLYITSPNVRVDVGT